MHLCQRFFQSSNMVVVERYALSFWRNGHEERVQCETVHYRDAKTTSCLPKIYFETVLSDPLEIPMVSARSLIINQRFLCTNSLICLTWCSSVDVDGRPGRSKSSTRSLPSLKSVPLVNIFLRHGHITEGLLQHSERFRNWIQTL